MGQRTWQATAQGVSRVRHHLPIKPLIREILTTALKPEKEALVKVVTSVSHTWRLTQRDTTIHPISFTGQEKTKPFKKQPLRKALSKGQSSLALFALWSLKAQNMGKTPHNKNQTFINIMVDSNSSAK